MTALRGLALSGGDWVIWLLLASSILAVAVIIERWKILAREAAALDVLRQRVLAKLDTGGLDGVAKELVRSEGLAARILLAGVSQAARGAGAAEEHMAAAGLEERRLVESRLLVLGTLGNNAPFVGLFGTVLGVIKAFHDLSVVSEAGPEVVMRGLSEALIATAVGLFVAIPSVVAYNYYQRRVKDLMSGSEALNRLLLARLKARS